MEDKEIYELIFPHALSSLLVRDPVFLVIQANPHEGETDKEALFQFTSSENKIVWKIKLKFF